MVPTVVENAHPVLDKQPGKALYFGTLCRLGVQQEDGLDLTLWYGITWLAFAASVGDKAQVFGLAFSGRKFGFS